MICISFTTEESDVVDGITKSCVLPCVAPICWALPPLAAMTREIAEADLNLH